MRCDTTLSGKLVPTFQGNIQPSKNKDNVSLLNGGNDLTEYMLYFKNNCSSLTITVALNSTFT